MLQRLLGVLTFVTVIHLTDADKSCSFITYFTGVLSSGQCLCNTWMIGRFIGTKISALPFCPNQLSLDRQYGFLTLLWMMKLTGITVRTLSCLCVGWTHIRVLLVALPPRQPKAARNYHRFKNSTLQTCTLALLSELNGSFRTS